MSDQKKIWEITTIFLLIVGISVLICVGLIVIGVIPL